jgi:hypothetical protein
MRKTILGLAFIFVSALLSAGNLTPGNIVIVRVGTGIDSLSSASTAVFLDEYTTAGTLVQSIALPTAVNGSNHALTLSGSATSEGSLNLSANGQYLTLAGYDTTTGYAGVSSGITNRTIGRVDASGTVNTSTGYLSGSAYKKNNIRSAVTNDGNEFWTAGTGSNATGGIWYVPFGSFTAAGVQTGTTNTNARVVNITDGQIYFSTASVATGIYTDGTGLPSTSGQTEAILPGLPTLDSLSSPYGLLFLDENPSVAGVDVLYVVDDNETAPGGGIYKYSLVGGTWVTNGNIPNANGLRGITGYKVCNGALLYLTAGNGIYTFLDSSGYNQTVRGSYTQIATAATNTVLRGIAFAPGSVAPTSPVASISSQSNVSCYGLGNGSINISVAGGVSPLSYAWTGGGTSPDLTGLAAGIYTVTVTDHIGCTSSVSDTITQPLSALAVTIDSITNLPCTGGSTGAITISVSGGTGIDHYTWTPGNITTQNISGLTAGTYIVTVTDSAGCTRTDSAIVSKSGSLSVSDSITPVSCYGLSDGAISVTVSGGTPSYTYSWSGSNAATPGINGLAAGSYTLTVSDQAGCILDVPLSVSQPDSLSLSLTAVGDTTHGGATGSIGLSVSGGTGSYTYLWSNTETTSNISTLTAGAYCVTVTDQQACRDSNCISVDQPTGINEPAWVSSFSVITADGYLKVDVTAAEQMNISAEMYDMAGQLIRQSARTIQSQLHWLIPTAEIPSGCYIIRISSDQGSAVKKALVIK